VVFFWGGGWASGAAVKRPAGAEALSGTGATRRALAGKRSGVFLRKGEKG